MLRSKLFDITSILCHLLIFVKGDANLTCVSKQTVLSTGYAITNHLDGLTCATTLSYCLTITTILDIDGGLFKSYRSASIVSRCADESDAMICSTLEDGQCYDKERENEALRTTMCCCSTPRCNDTPYKEGTETHQVDTDMKPLLESADGAGFEYFDRAVNSTLDTAEEGKEEEDKDVIDDDQLINNYHSIKCLSTQSSIIDGRDVVGGSLEEEETCSTRRWCMTITAVTSIKNSSTHSTTVSSKCVLFADEARLCSLHAADTCFNVNADGLQTSFCCCSSNMCNIGPHRDAIAAYLDPNASQQSLQLRQPSSPVSKFSAAQLYSVECETRRLISINGLTTVTRNGSCTARQWCTTITNNAVQADGTDVVTVLSNCAEGKMENLCNRRPDLRIHCFDADLHGIETKVCCCSKSQCNQVDPMLKNADNVLVSVVFNNSFRLNHFSNLLIVVLSIFSMFSMWFCR